MIHTQSIPVELQSLKALDPHSLLHQSKFLLSLLRPPLTIHSQTSSSTLLESNPILLPSPARVHLTLLSHQLLKPPLPRARSPPKPVRNLLQSVRPPLDSLHYPNSLSSVDLPPPPPARNPVSHSPPPLSLPYLQAVNSQPFPIFPHSQNFSLPPLRPLL